MTLRTAYAGDRDIGVRVLDHLLERGVHPLALLVSEANRATHAEDLTRRCTTLNRQTILHGVRFRTPVPPVDLFRRLRALTTNDISEAAHYEVAGKRYRIQVNITEDSSTELYYRR